MNMNCRDSCKWLGYDYIEDENGAIKGDVGYKCELYKHPLGQKPLKCKECLENKKYNKGDLK